MQLPDATSEPQAAGTRIGRFLPTLIALNADGFMLLRRLCWPLLDLGFRIWLAQQFFVSGLLKVTHWQTACTVAMNAAESVTATFAQDVTFVISVTGSGTVVSSPPGLNCTTTCSAIFAPGTQVTLTATPASGWDFYGWSDDCSGNHNCVLTMVESNNVGVTATFTHNQFTLNVSETGSGNVVSNPTGISCPSTCNASFTSGTPVTLTATPTQGMSFIGWSGACSGTGGCSVTMSAAESVSAAFTTNGDPRKRPDVGLGDLGQRLQSMHPIVALPDLRRGAGPDPRRRRDRRPRSGRLRPGDHHQVDQHLR